MITNTTAKITYTFTEGITEYAVGFVYQTNPDGSPQIKVYINDAVNTPLVYGTDYTMSQDGTKVVIASGAEVGDSLTIIRNIPIVQLSDYVVGRIDPEQIENDFDLCVERDQQQSARITVTEEQLAAHDERISDIEDVVPESATTDNLLATVSDIPTVNDTTITFTQGGTTKGTITLNQASAATIAFDAGGGGGSGAVDSVNGYTGVVVLTASDVGALSDSTTIPDAQIQSDWGQSDNTKVDYIKNKPSIPTVNDSTITITQGGVTKGTFTTNQGSASTIALDAGGTTTGQTIDAEIVGSPTINNDSVVGNLSNQNYLALPGQFDMTGANDFQIVMAFVTKDVSSWPQQVFFCENHGPAPKVSIEVLQSKLHLYIYNEATQTAQTLTGSTTLSSNTKYYVMLAYNGTDYVLSLSTDGVTYNQEATAAAQFVPGHSNYGYIIGSYSQYAPTVFEVYLDGCYIKKNGVIIWQGMDAPGLHQRVAKGHEVIAFQAPTAANNYTWYRKYADGWVEQGGYATTSGNTGAQITLPVTMSDAHYLINGTCNNDTTGGAFHFMIYENQTTTGFAASPAYAGEWRTGAFYWEVRGMAAN